VPSIHTLGEIANRFAVEQEIGRGATSVVYLAQDFEHGRKVALKVLRRDVVESVGVERFLREIRLTAQLQHPHIVPVLGSGEIDGDLYFVLPYMDGGTLRERLVRDRQLPIPDVISIGVTIASALAFAHERNLLHRDVKPENILFTAGQACLADFGLARPITIASGEHSTSTGIVRGTPAYMSPEQASGERDYDGRSDVYSLACVLYEALAGVQAFVGPTPQSVLAQRMYHEPRPVSIYRSSVSRELDAVLAKALAISPADRYPSAAAFRDALTGATIAPSKDARVPSTAARRITVACAAAGILGIGSWMLRSMSVLPWNSNAPLDTTRIAVLPFARDEAIPLSAQAADYIVDAVSHWKGVRAADQFRVSDAVARHPGGSVDPARIALEAGAGRFIRGRLAPIGDSLLIELKLYDNRGRAPLRSASGHLAKSDSSVERFFRSLVDSILIGGDGHSLTSDRVASTSSLPATQSFVAGLSALDEWDLSRADSLFAIAISYDAKFARARVWQAQVEDWRRQPPRAYGGSIDAALADSNNLTERERTFARGLSLLARGAFQDACRVYEAMRRQDDRDFTAWFGLARCQSLDDVVIPDTKSPSTWSYRSSYHRAVQAYARALQLLPSTYRGFERGGFDALQGLLYTRGDRVRMGTTLTGQAAFAARPSWSGDSLVFVPFPIAVVSASVSDPTSRTKPEALRRQRAVFHEITSTWARAFPRSSGAKEALAMSLDMLGDRAAADSLRSARILAHDHRDRARLAATEAIVRIKFAIPDDIRELERGVSIADSVLARAAEAQHDEAIVELPLAALTGRCKQVDDLARRGAEPSRSIPVHLDAAGRSVTVRAALSCGRQAVQSALDSLIRVIDATPETAPNAEMIRLWVLAQAMSLSFPTNAALLPKFMKAGANPLFDAELAVLEGDTNRARASIERVIKAREQSQLHPGDGTPDAVLIETRVMLALKDTTRAMAWLDASLAQVSKYHPRLFSTNSAAAGSLVATMALRADLAHAAGDAKGAARWATVVAILLRRADQSLNETQSRMRQFAGR
jgi:serine/threonine protein kinase